MRRCARAIQRFGISLPHRPIVNFGVNFRATFWALRALSLVKPYFLNGCPGSPGTLVRSV
jgi:hypothetical protein